ncbi:MAG: nickel pincer cofactor biosynthesis protein LarC2, partial [Nostoc sp.]
EDSSQNLETISVLETQIDDLNPQAIGYVFEALFAAGALDVFTQAIGMKKSRPGILLTVICHPENLLSCEAVLFRETTTLGIRRITQQRTILQREIQQVEIEYGKVRVKVA